MTDVAMYINARTVSNARWKMQDDQGLEITCTYNTYARVYTPLRNRNSSNIAFLMTLKTIVDCTRCDQN